LDKKKTLRNKEKKERKTKGEKTRGIEGLRKRDLSVFQNGPKKHGPKISLTNEKRKAAGEKKRAR